MEFCQSEKVGTLRKEISTGWVDMLELTFHWINFKRLDDYTFVN